ncbi:MAG: hypothetical protein HKM24_08095 [Gammaproteobacteria bacterium]|nr:hypothetical protein [Gammaproteobacteria bacterium]
METGTLTDWINKILDDQFAVQTIIILVVIGFLVMQFLRWKNAGSNSRNRRKKNKRALSRSAGPRFPTKDPFKEAQIRLTPDEIETLVKLEGQVKNQDQQIEDLQSELAARMDTISALEEDVETWHKDWSNLEGQLRSNQQPAPPPTPTVEAEETLPPKQPPLPAANDDADDLADYIATWVKTTAQGAEKESTAESKTPIQAERIETLEPFPLDDERVAKVPPQAPAKKPQSPVEVNQSFAETTGTLLSHDELLGISRVDVSPETQSPKDEILDNESAANESMVEDNQDFTDTIVALQKELLKKQSVIDRLKTGESASKATAVDTRSDEHYKEVEDLKIALKGKSELIENLRDSVHQLREFRSVAKERADVIARLQSELQSHTDNSSSLESDLDSWQQRYTSLEKQNKELSSAVSEFKNHIKTKNEEVASLEKDLDELRTKVPEMEQTFEAQKEERDRLRGLVDQQNKKVETLNKTIEDHETTFANELKQQEETLTKKLREHEQILADEQHSRTMVLEKSHEAIAALKSKLDEKDNEVSDLRLKLLEIDAEMSGGMSSGNELVSRVAELEKTIRQRDDRIGLLQTELNEKSSRMEALNTQVELKVGRVTQMEQTIEQKNMELDSLRKSGAGGDASNEALQKLQKELEDKKQTIERLTDKLTSAQENLKAKESEISELSGDESHTVTQIISTLGKTVGLEKVSDNWQTDVSDINSKLKAHTKEVGQLRDQITQLRDIEATANIQDEAIMQMKIDLQEREKRIRELEGQVRNWESQWQHFEDTVAQDKHTIVEDFAATATRLQSIAALQAEVSGVPKAEAEEKLKNAALETLKRDLGVADSSIKEMEAALNAIKPGAAPTKANSPQEVPKLKKLVRHGKEKKRRGLFGKK